MERIIYKYCAVLGVDGMGRYNEKANTPRLDALFADGATTFDAFSMDPTISAENWGAMLLGATPVVHGLTNGYISQNVNTNRDLPSVFTQLRRVYPEAYLASVCNWDPINHGIVEHDVGVDMATADKDGPLNEIIIEKVKNKPKFLFVQYDDVDGAGHHYGYGTEGHIKQIEYTDGLIGAVVDAYKEAGIFDDTLFIVLADHGGIRTGHGGYTDEEKYIFFGVAGKGIEKSHIKFARTVDIAATVLYALGAPLPPYDLNAFSSQVPEGVFPWYEGKYVVSQAGVKTAVTLPSKPYAALAAAFGGERIKLALFFDNEIKDETGKCRFTEYGTVKYYSNGVRSACAEFGATGCAETNDLAVGDGSFTVAAWLLTDRSIKKECVVCANKDWWWQKRREQGFALVMKNNDTVLLLGSGKDEFGLVTPFPDDHKEGWLHTMAAVDKAAGEIRVYYDFKHIRAFRLPEGFAGSFDAFPFVVGNDVGRKNNTETFPNIFRMDDLIVFDGAFTDADAETLRTFYES